MHQPARNLDGLGYLIWNKLPADCFGDPHLAALLERDSLDLAHPYEALVAAARETVLQTTAALKRRGIWRVRMHNMWHLVEAASIDRGEPVSVSSEVFEKQLV